MKEIIVILDNVRSALNVGAIFRSCDGALVSKLYLVGITPYPPHPKVLKTALGADQYVKFEHVKDVSEVLNKLKSEGFEIISIEQTHNSTDFRLYKFNNKVAFIFGNEITGVSTKAINESDKVLQLPMLGKKNSLNVATTLGIVIYNIRLNE